MVGFRVGVADYKCGRNQGLGSRLQMRSESGFGQQKIVYIYIPVRRWPNMLAL